MFYIVGLGNPGAKYEGTRHNVGFAALQYLVAKHALPKPVSSSRYSGEVSEGVLYGNEVILLFPHTYMNNSGSAVRKLVTSTEDASRLMVIHDEVDLPIGELKLSFGRGSGGHNGAQSIMSALSTKQFARLRIGVAGRSLFGKVKRPKGEKLSDHVLSSFKRSEERKLSRVFERMDGVIEHFLTEGVEKAMHICNS